MKFDMDPRLARKARAAAAISERPVTDKESRRRTVVGAGAVRPPLWPDKGP